MEYQGARGDPTSEQRVIQPAEQLLANDGRWVVFRRCGNPPVGKGDSQIEIGWGPLSRQQQIQLSLRLQIRVGHLQAAPGEIPATGLFLPLQQTL